MITYKEAQIITETAIKHRQQYIENLDNQLINCKKYHRCLKKTLKRIHKAACRGEHETEIALLGLSFLSLKRRRINSLVIKTFTELGFEIRDYILSPPTIRWY